VPESGSGQLQGKVAIVSGAARGIGEAIARLFVAEGSSVLLGDVLVAPGEAVAHELGERAHFEELNVADPEHWRRVVQRCHSIFGGPDILVANAGVNCAKPIHEITRDDFLRVFDVNVIGVFLGIQAVAPGMVEKGAGSIVVMSSSASDTGLSHHAVYGPSKAASASLARNAAVELAGRGIRVNSLHPGVVDTDMSRAVEGVDKDAWYRTLSIQRAGDREEVARAALFLASDASSYATGSKLVVDGGQLAGPAAVF
jgi:3alpha(or 20beta)-hydroxysteroid dehydrogenase